MLGKLALPAIRELLELGDEKTLREALNRWLPADLAELADALPGVEQVQVLRLIQPKRAAETIAYLDLDAQQFVLTTISPEEAKFVLNEMAPDDRTALLAELPPAEAERFINLLDQEERDIARALLEYRADSVGRLMTPDYLVVRREWTMRHVLDHIRAHGRDRETLNVIYITDQNNKLVDDLRIREILLAPLHAHVSDLMDNQFVSLCVTDGRKKAVEVFGKYDRTALPVVDTQGRIAGIITLDDVLDVAEQEATRDLQRFGGLEALDDPYMSTALPAMIRKRELARDPLRRRNAHRHGDELLRGSDRPRRRPGSLRPLDHLERRQLRLASRHPHHPGSRPRRSRSQRLVAHLRRELVAGVLLGCILASIGFLRIAAWNAFSNIYGPHWFLVASTVSLSLIGVVVWGTLTGSMLPFLLRRLGFDPATSSAPFVATLVDVTGLIIYFTVAILLLRGTLL